MLRKLFRYFRVRNRVLTYLIYSDVMLISAISLTSPIFSLFITEDLVGGTIASTGVAATMFLLTKSALQLPSSNWADKHGKKNAILIGTFIIALASLGYYFSVDIYQLYLMQMFYGVGAALSYPAWLALFSMNLDKRHESHDYGVYGTIVGVSGAVTATLGAELAEAFGYRIVFLLGFILSIIGFVIIAYGLETDGKIR